MRPLAWLMLLRALAAAEPKSIHGVVVDAQSGAPLGDVCIDHYGGFYCNGKTDESGTFRIETRAAAAVFRKENYAPERVKLDREDLRIELRASSLAAPLCDQRCNSGVGGSLCFADVKGVKASKRGRDVDYVDVGYIARIGKHRGFINHGEGSSWSLGLPNDDDVWNSVQYAERDFTFWGGRIVDARGTRANGTVWRYLGKMSESANYYGVDDARVAALLDRVLDGFCVVKPR